MRSDGARILAANGRKNSRPTARPCLSGEGGGTAIAVPPSDAKKARPTAKANENGRWSGWKLAMKEREKAQAAALFRRLSSALASSRAHTPLIRSGITKGVTHQARLVARSLPDMNMNQAVPKV